MTPKEKEQLQHGRLGEYLAPKMKKVKAATIEGLMKSPKGQSPAPRPKAPPGVWTQAMQDEFDYKHAEIERTMDRKRGVPTESLAQTRKAKPVPTMDQMLKNRAHRVKSARAVMLKKLKQAQREDELKNK